MASKNLVIIPTYNEKNNIEKLISNILAYKENYDILIVDDNSPDGTADIVQALINNQSTQRIFLKQRPKKLGLGTAYILGFKFALEQSYDFIFQIDADFSHNPDDLFFLYKQTQDQNTHVTIGSRYINGISIVNWPIQRLLLSYFAGVYIRFITRMRIMDPTAGYVCFRREVLEQIPFEKIKFKGYAFQIEMKFITLLYGFNIAEIPIIFTERTIGKSKMSNNIVLEAFLGVLSIPLLHFPMLIKKIKKNLFLSFK
ncbi:MAG: polyprenol monophosphomannose synthase [Pseudomonadota bacterium]